MSGAIGGGGGTGGPSPSEKSQKYRVKLSKTGPDPLKIIKPQSQHSMLGNHRPASKTQFKWRFAGGPMVAHL